MSIRIQLSPATVKALQTRLQHAYKKDDVRLVRRITVLIDLLVHHVPIEGLHERWGVGLSTVYEWHKTFLLRGLDSLIYRHGGGAGNIHARVACVTGIAADNRKLQ